MTFPLLTASLEDLLHFPRKFSDCERLLENTLFRRVELGGAHIARHIQEWNASSLWQCDFGLQGHRRSDGAARSVDHHGCGAGVLIAAGRGFRRRPNGAAARRLSCDWRGPHTNEKRNSFTNGNEAIPFAKPCGAGC
jgi:hypothetical protein